ncbi:MAG: pyridoxal phosphate-dependent aminotransferase [Thermoanaerobaculia bacterium]|nr:pyridoxal phosphate-dependent aminotransferase [Thermoanaerobaculia bacterium]
MRLSRRVDWHRQRNSIARAVQERRERRLPLIDLTVSNPTAVGLRWPESWSFELARGSREPYDPDPRGLLRAREALAEWLGNRGAEAVSAEELLLTSSTSEAYSWILKILCDSGDRIIRFTPTYPLLDHLCTLESVELEDVPLERTGEGWMIGVRRELVGEVRGAIVVHPNNPTGHLTSPGDVRTLSRQLTRSGGALIADEVFFEFGPGGARRIASDADCLTFSLGGLSKSAALPHWKLGWIRVTGPDDAKKDAIAALELVADTFLPVSAAIQHALPSILESTDQIRDAIHARVRSNLETIDRAIADLPAIRRDPYEGGWSGVLRVPIFEDEEHLVVDLVDRGVLVHPGFFYDFPNEGWIVVSLIVPNETMESGIAVIREYFEGRW